MYLVTLIIIVIVCGQAHSFWFGNLTFGPKGATFSKLKEEAEKEFLKKFGHDTFQDYVSADWLKFWNPNEETYKKYNATEIKNDALDWWNEVHNYIPPKKKECRRRRRKCKRDVAEGNPFLQDSHHNRQKRSHCVNIPGPPLDRRDWRQMSQADRNSFISAFNAMINENVPGTDDSQHNIFTEQHRVTNAPTSHNGAGFLPWHREFLWRLSNVLRIHGYSGGLPYWDNIVDVALPNPADSAVWTSVHFGVNSGLVTSPWNNIDTITACQLQGSGALRRDMKTGEDARALMMDRDVVDTILALPCFQDLTAGWNPLFEEQHERMLLLMGTQNTAQMADANCAPTDPVYWLHTAFMDCIWERYRDGQDFVTREIEYPEDNLAPNNSEVNPRRHRWNRRMQPFEGLINIHGLSNHYTSYYYSCREAPSNITCQNDSDCGGDLLWCLNNLCMSKIREGGRCDPDWPNVQCDCTSGIPSCNGGTRVCQC